MRNQLRSLYFEARKLFKWTLYSKQASLAIADQAVISISSLLLTVVIARTAGIEVLGGFGVILVLSVFGGMALASLVSAPAMVLFASMERDADRYKGFLLAASVLIGLPLTIVLSTIYVIYRQHLGIAISRSEIFIVAFLFLIIPVQSTLRRAAFARARPWAGLRLSVIANIPSLIALLYVFPATHTVQLSDILLVVLVANLTSVVVDLVIDQPRIPGRRFFADMVRRHWHLSRWLLLSSFFNSTYEQIFTLAAGFIFGDHAVAAIRISQQTFGIIFAAMQTFENTLPRQFALLARGDNHAPYKLLVNLLAGIVFFSVAICGGFLWWFGNDLILFVFSIDYRNYTNLLIFWALSIACSGARSIFAMACRAMQDTKPIFIADACSFIVGAIIVFPVLHWLGVIGSAVGMLATNIVGLTVLLVLMPWRNEGRDSSITVRR